MLLSTGSSEAAEQCTAVAVHQPGGYYMSISSLTCFFYGVVVGFLVCLVMWCKCGGQRKTVTVNQSLRAQYTYTFVREVAVPRFLPLSNLGEIGGAA